MPPSTAPPTWRLLALVKSSGLPCAGCGQVHRYLMRMTAVGDCLPMLFLPGVPAPSNTGVEIDAQLAGPIERSGAHDARSRYHTGGRAGAADLDPVRGLRRAVRGTGGLPGASLRGARPLTADR